ncbi:hypothetical protein F5Y14DRAFT_463317 [Nemania sp. NC0429]|nr:hypothetical protein F5Y14DRAFT_463317 [Nemania sp. NC0429]
MADFFLQQVIHDVDHNLDADIILFILHRGAWFRIDYLAQNLAHSPYLSKQHQEFNEILYEDNGDEQYQGVVEHLRRPFEDLMTQLAHNPCSESMRPLFSYLYPPSFILEATVSDGHIQPNLKGPLSRQQFRRPGQYMGIIEQHVPSFASRVSVYSSRQVQVLAHTPWMAPTTVCIDNVKYFFKPRIGHGYHELQSYNKILMADEESPSLLHSAHICRLHGLVIDSGNDVLQHYHLDSDEEDAYWDDPPDRFLVGLLLTCIKNEGTMYDLAPRTDCTNEDRGRWLRQIRGSVQSLHAAGVVWGDAKPSNVLIGEDGNAYLIDFGGSYTQGWVDEDKMETVEGDLQGLERIEKFLVDCSERPNRRGGVET